MTTPLPYTSPPRGLPSAVSVGSLVRPVWRLVGGLLLGLAVLVLVVSWRAREEGRAQLLARDAELFETVFLAEWQPYREAVVSAGESVGPDDFWVLASSVSELRGVVAAGIYDPTGATLWASFPQLWPLPVAPLTTGRARAEWHPALAAESLFADVWWGGSAEEGPLVEVVVAAPGADGEPLALAQYWIEGESMAREFVALDRRLAWQGVVVWGLAALMVVGLGSFASRRVRGMGAELAARQESLERVNRELELAARASAVGAISAHLLHGLKNPLGGLRAYLRAQEGTEAARAAADRMQRLIEETLAVLRDERRAETGPLALSEFHELLGERFGGEPEVRLEADGAFAAAAEAPAALGLFEARMALLILENLLRNAREASPEEAVVTLAGRLEGTTLVLSVTDSGPGVAADIRERLFEPGVSGRAESGGSGLGLALSRHLARAVGGEVQLASTGPTGTTFEVCLPLKTNF